jgi:hypothetical protein
MGHNVNLPINPLRAKSIFESKVFLFADAEVQTLSLVLADAKNTRRNNTFASVSRRRLNEKIS